MSIYTSTVINTCCGSSVKPRHLVALHRTLKVIRTSFMPDYKVLSAIENEAEAVNFCFIGPQ